MEEGRTLSAPTLFGRPAAKSSASPTPRAGVCLHFAALAGAGPAVGAGGMGCSKGERERTKSCDAAAARARSARRASPLAKKPNAPLHTPSSQRTVAPVVGRLILANSAVVCSLRRRTPKKESSSTVPAIFWREMQALFFFFSLAGPMLRQLLVQQ